MPGVSPQGVFLSYRRDDAGPYARSLQRELSERIPDARVFMDLDSIEPGLDFAEVIQGALDSCAVLVALIGRQWATLTDEEGVRRLDSPDDYVRFEVTTALERGVRVIPVLIDSAKPLRQQELPAELHKLARLNAAKLSYDRYQDDVNRLLDLIQRVLTAAEADSRAREEAELPTLEEQARLTGEAGDAAGARDQFAALVPTRVRVSGPEDPETLWARYKLAYWTGEAGDGAAARDQIAALVPVFERVFGLEASETLMARHYLANLAGVAGDAIGARDQNVALLPVFERVLGPEHPETLRVRRNLVNWTGEAGDAAGARDQAAALLPVHERAFGPEHPLTLKVRYNLASWTGEAGDAAGARDQFAALLPVQERALGPQHRETLMARRNLTR